MIIDQFLIGAGMPLSVTDAAKRYGRAIADPGEPLLKAAPSSSGSPNGDELGTADENQFAPDQNRPGRTNVADQ